ncbi:MAG: hypothetical protein PHV95_09140 [Eubacteriales bacterium]|nr:hypothetical protein [Eubacteriales bacterium]MDD4475932.1 hypothetical protein [Eubacteriales bacterium]
MENNIIKFHPQNEKEQSPLSKGGWSDSYKESTAELSNFIKGLPLDQETNDQLIALMVKNVELSFRDGFNCGYEFRDSEQAIMNALTRGNKRGYDQ